MNLVYPMFAMVLLTAGVMMIMFRSRVRAVRSKDVRLNYFKTYNSLEVPEYMITPARHFTNLFETPVLFYAGCLAAMVLNRQGPVVLCLAWGYVLTRYLHAYIHLGKNDVMVRTQVYALSWIFLIALWVSLVV